jgi:hypothetical protein
VSGVSRATGAETDVSPGRAGTTGRRRGAVTLPLEVQLEHARWRNFAWAAAGIVVAALLIGLLATVFKWLGALLLAVSGIGVWAFVMTLLHPPGRIRVSEAEVSLARGLCRGVEVTLPLDRVRHAFLLRRATRTGPLLVVETDDGVFTYPRDWFGSDSDQRRVALALNQRLGRA